MPRRNAAIAESAPPMDAKLVDRLAAELLAERESGQPVIYEQQLPSGKLRVTVVWDEWDRLPLEGRTAAILRAYDRAEGAGARERIALASGLTVPEAYAAGMLPVQIIAARRPGDPVTDDQCREAMLAEGASILYSPETPQLRFASVDEAEAARERLARRLPGSEAVWVVTQDAGRVDDWAAR